MWGPLLYLLGWHKRFRNSVDPVRNGPLLLDTNDLIGRAELI